MKLLRFSVIVAIILAFMVVLLGAYTRLTDAGLGCPDWPGCYGKLIVPKVTDQALQNPIESSKAWTEMIHRYAAGTLAFLILMISFSSVYLRFFKRSIPLTIPLLLIGLIVFQALLGMWTVTLKLSPIVVMGHLLGGVILLSLLCYFRLQLSSIQTVNNPFLRGWIIIGVIMVLFQIALGGAVSSHYAGVACIGFPQCNGEWIPSLSWKNGFHLWEHNNINYQGGILDHQARVTIHFIHRLGALITAGYILCLSFIVIRYASIKELRIAAVGTLSLVVIQFGLGIINVTYLLPLWVAVAHNSVAALLLATVLSMYYLTTRRTPYAF